MTKSLAADRFFDVPRHEHPTSAGPVALPILYRDATAVFAFFAVPAPAAAALVADRELQLAAVRAGRTVVGVACFAYRDTTIGAYNEVGIAIPVVPAGAPALRAPALDLLRDAARRTVGFYVAELPVTTELACAAGRELWGYPKFVTAIDVSLAGRQLACTVHAPDGNNAIMRLAGRVGFGAPAPPFSFVDYDRLGQQRLRTQIDARGWGRLHGRGDVRMHVGPAAHPMSDTLRQLALDGARPLALMTNRRAQTRLNAGVPW